MAKKPKSFSHIHATEALEQLGQCGISASEFIYELLRIFAGYGDGQVRRIKEGTGNAAKDGKTILIKNLIAYREADTNDTVSMMHDIIEDMRSNVKITKHKPRLYVVYNGTTIVAYDPKENDVYENSIELMWKDFEFFKPLAGIEKIEYSEEAEADVKSAELMAKLFDDIRRYNDIGDPKMVHALNIFMSRLLFCFFAEDTGLFPEQNLFTDTIATHTKDDGSDLQEFIDRAFFAMSTNNEEALAALPELYKKFPYVNGGLFKERYPIPVLSRRARTLILNCGEYNWKKINPDIFGSMIQAVVTPEQRAGLGMHYTSVTNIEKVIKPLFLDSLIEEYTAACEEAREKIAQRVKFDRATQRLNKLLGRIANIKFFDPACGSGNFLIITYKRLRELEIKIWQALRDIAQTTILPISNIRLTQFYGIELDEYACDTATLSLWLAEHQMNVMFHDAFDVQPETLPLKPSGNIVCGNACRIDWNTVCPHDKEDEVYIMGNPPYLGYVLQELNQKEDLQFVFQGKTDYKKLDYISCWIYKAAVYVSNSHARAGIVSTNSVCQGEQLSLLWPPIFEKGVQIFYAYRSFKWKNNAKHNAIVTCVIIGLASNPSICKLYDEDAVTDCFYINPYLTTAKLQLIEKRSKPLSTFPIMCKGSQPADGGLLLLSMNEVEQMMEENPDAQKFIKPFIGASELINDTKRFCLWITETEKDKALNIPAIEQRVDGVRVFRLKSTKKATVEWAEKPYSFTECRYKDNDCIIIPRHSSERRVYIPMGYLSTGNVIADSAFAIYNAEKWLFALLSSKMHNLWVRAVGGALETRIRYSATLCYNTFPFPKLTIEQKEELEKLAQNILNIRDENFDMTLGEMYNPETMPNELKEAHHQLDLVVERIYRPEPFTSDEERLEHLFKLYSKMTKK